MLMQSIDNIYCILLVCVHCSHIHDAAVLRARIPRSHNYHIAVTLKKAAWAENLVSYEKAIDLEKLLVKGHIMDGFSRAVFQLWRVVQPTVISCLGVVYHASHAHELPSC